MPRETSPYVVGEYWLDKRRDGKSPDIWQIASGTRQVRYRSTRKRDLDDAKAVIHAHVEKERAKAKQQPEDAKVIPHLVLYWEEHGRNNINQDQTGRSLRTFIAFLLQDTAGPNAVVTDMTPVLFERFRLWRMGPHSFSLKWSGEQFDYSSEGVSGTTVQRNINDIRAAIRHAEANMRIPATPRIRDVEKRHRTAPRNRVLSIEELGQIAWYSFHFPEMFRFVALQMATSVRPTAANQFDPRRQYDPRSHLIDLQPDELPQTKKRNAIIPAIRPMRPVLKAWADDGAHPIKSRKTAWRTMRRVLGLSNDVYPKTIRHTVATMLHEMEWVPGRQISEMLGHANDSELSRTSQIYAKYRPERMGKVVKGLSIIWLQVSREARKISAVQTLSIEPWHGKITIAPKEQNG